MDNRPTLRPRRPFATARLAAIMAIITCACLAAPAVRAEGQDPKSAQLVKELVDAMTQRQLTAIATRHPKESDRYVAAMLFPGVQLLLVSARSSSPAYIESQLSTSGGDAAVYAALHQGATDGKIFIQDMGCDGLRGGVGGLADVVYTDGVNERILNGDHKAARLSREAYARVAQQTEAEYSALLGSLLEAAKARTVTASSR